VARKPRPRRNERVRRDARWPRSSWPTCACGASRKRSGPCSPCSPSFWYLHSPPLNHFAHTPDPFPAPPPVSMRSDQQTTEATDVETKETLLLFLCLCARTRQASHNGGGNEAAPTGLPPGLAAVMPQAIFASLTADWQQAEESLAATRYDSVL